MSQIQGVPLDDVLAQAMCQGAAPDNNRVFAVGRSCTDRAGSCRQICENPHLKNQDGQAAVLGPMFCVNAFHVYRDRPVTDTNGNIVTATLGLKSKKESCEFNGCGPNYCCCLVVKHY